MAAFFHVKNEAINLIFCAKKSQRWFPVKTECEKSLLLYPKNVSPLTILPLNGILLFLRRFVAVLTVFAA